jgi:hypothetical protein
MEMVLRICYIWPSVGHDDFCMLEDVCDMYCVTFVCCYVGIVRNCTNKLTLEAMYAQRPGFEVELFSFEDNSTGFCDPVAS